MSVVEVLVALMLVTIGLLGIAGSTALALRTTLEAGQRREAMERTASRLARLSAEGCAPARAGMASDPRRGVTERWTVSSANAHFASVRDSVRWMSARGPRTFLLESAIAC
jgi:Tfp pilus assembly protein PilV